MATAELMSTGQSVAVAGLSISFGDVRVFEGLAFSVPAGGSLAITGPSGSGKSSLLDCITGVAVPADGTVNVGALRVSDLDDGSRAEFRRRHVGLMFQAPELLPELSVLENVALVAIFDGLPRAKALAAAAAALDGVGLNGLGDRRVRRLSGGEAQRVSLARALARDDIEVVVADEPTASLDAANVERMADLLVEFTRARGATLLVATHDQRVADRMDASLDIASRYVVDGAP